MEKGGYILLFSDGLENNKYFCKMQKDLSKIPNVEGVYFIQNLINNKIYIGSSKNLYRRYHNHKNALNSKSAEGCIILYKSYKRYGISNFKFNIIKITKDYHLWEDLFIRLLNPEYNIATVIGGKNQPNIGKKFNKNWSNKLHKCVKHNETTYNLLNQLNKENACKIVFEKDNIILNFDSWKEAGKYFNIENKSPSAYFCKTIINNIFRWKKWNISIQKKQKKEVILKTNNNQYKFASANDCDRFLNLWRGATSNAIKNNNGFLHNNIVEYI